MSISTIYLLGQVQELLMLSPQMGLVDAASKEKIAPACENSPKIAALLKSKAIRYIEFNNLSSYEVTGVLRKSGGRAGSKDIITFDESDFIPDSVYHIYTQMLSHSKLALIRNVSTSTTPNIGIDLQVSEGSDNHWFWVCAKCKHEQEFIFPESVINFFDWSGLADLGNESYLKKLDKVYLGCVKCKEPVDRNSDFYCANSRWIASREALMGDNSSYRVTAGMIPWKTGKELTHKFYSLQVYPNVFYNEVWGTTFLRAENKIK